MCMKDEHLRPYVAGPLYHHEALNGSGYPNGLSKDDIPYEGQIIRVADEYDAIVSKRQYKSHIGISDTLKILIENSKPFEQIPKSSALKQIVENAKYGKNNPIIVKALIKVVIDDVNYEIYCAEEYLEYLAENIKRLETAEKYYNNMKTAKNENKKEYFLEYTKMYFEKGESIDNFLTIKQEYIDAYNIRKQKIDSLYNEIKVIKKLKV